jgi:hypothetical protein
MKNALKAIAVAVLMVSMCMLMNPRDARAQQCNYPGCFSGLSLPFMYSCTCSTYYNYMIFFPFNSNGSTFAAAMSVPMAVSYSTYSTSPAQKYVGTYIPGVQSCWIYAVYGCFTLPVYGTVIEATGVGQPGAYTP